MTFAEKGVPSAAGPGGDSLRGAICECTTIRPRTEPIKAVVLFGTGVAVIANVPIPAGAGLRLLDLVCLMAAAGVVARLLTCRVAPLVLWALVLAGALLPAVLTGLMSGDLAHAVSALRLVLSILCGLMLADMTRNGGAPAFCAGAAVGGLAVAALALAQLYSAAPLLDALSPPDTVLWWYGDRLRATGIWSHPNELGQVQALGVTYALCLALALRHSGGQLCAVAMAFGIVGLTFAATQTRAFLAVSAVLTLLALARLAASSGTGGRLAIAGLAVSASCAVAVAFGERFSEVTAGGQTLGDNLAGRFMSWVEAADLMVAAPWGYGFEGRLDAIAEASGALSAAHNAFLSLGLTYGAPVALAAFCATLWVATAPVLTGRRSPYALTGIALLTLFLAEDSLFSGSMQVALSLAVFSLLGAVPGRVATRRSPASDRPPRAP
ncbi:O-antigen ligase family protein [Histidinibacterium lentulum]|uniref:O-antigen ligase-related domain-containing protein n=1 Tax=Histidinibacterium lentulum TaxID=2480588 RepID=A0A3N2QS50_9RHOB|nr:O-antigen ligase family protein [Histidinibacterium lentulum]ROT98041.1 hypothetical protein EAT49_17370 [Histidinibacterium lentulum]